MSTTPAHLRGDFAARIGIYLVLIAASFAQVDGETLHWIAACFLLVDLALYIIWRPPFLPIIAAWKLAYVALICREGITDATIASALCGRNPYDIASQYVTAANAALLLGHLLVSTVAMERITHQPYPMDRVNGRRWFWFTAFLLLAFAVNEIPAALTHLSGGRSAAQQIEVETSVENALRSGIAAAISVSMPSILTYYLLWIRRTNTWITLLIISPIAIMQMVMGARFVVLMSLGGVVAIVANKQGINKRALAIAGAVAGVLVLASGLMASSRYEGFSALTFGRYMEYVGEHGAIHSEGMVVNLAALVNYFQRMPHMEGRSTATILMFWIPRALWLEKPTLMGHWFARIASSHAFSHGHSIGLTFSADAYADFGFVGGIFVCTAIGLIMGLVERKMLRLAMQPGSPLLVALAPLYGAAVFAIRSLDTAFIVTTGFFGVGGLTAFFCTRRRQSVEVPPALRFRAGGAVQ